MCDSDGVADNVGSIVRQPYNIQNTAEITIGDARYDHLLLHHH